MRSRRAQWAEQVRRWRQSGLTAREFAGRRGIKVGTLSHWAWRLKRATAADPDGGPVKRAVRPRARFVEVVAGTIEDRRFEVELGDGRRLRIPTQFEATELERVLTVLSGLGR